MVNSLRTMPFRACKIPVHDMLRLGPVFPDFVDRSLDPGCYRYSVHIADDGFYCSIIP
jgi:hypothetical protein